MSSAEIRNCIDNREKLYEELEKIIESLPQETSESFEELFEDGNIDEVYHIINKIFPNSVIALPSLKLLFFLENPELKDKLFSHEEYTSIIKDLADMYGKNLSEIINVNSSQFNVSDLDPLLSFDDPKYPEVYRSVLEKKLSSVFSLDGIIGVLKNSNTSIVSEELITNFLENYNHPMMSSDVKEFLKILPSSILQDGTIAKKMFEKLTHLFREDVEVLDYIPSNAYDSQFVNEVLDKVLPSAIDVAFTHIPTELRTREVWEKVCDVHPAHFLPQLPNNNIDPNISQEEYDLWLEDLITKKIAESPEKAVDIFSYLDDAKKTISICQNVADISIENNSYKYNRFLELIPESSRTQRLYETLVSKSLKILKDIPLQSFIPNVSQEEYDKWFENLISKTIKSITSKEDMLQLCYSIPKEKINERIWNELLDNCIQNNFDNREFASLSIVNFENMTPQMVERAMKKIDKCQLYDVPCIDQNLDDLSDVDKAKYAKWQSSFTEVEKQAYRNWYEQIWIKFVNENHAYGSLYEIVPKEAITTAMNKACIDVNYRSIEQMPIPETPEQLHEYQQMLIYALGKITTIDYNKYEVDQVGEDILENISKEYINEEVVRNAIKRDISYLNYADPVEGNFSELLDIAYKDKLAYVGRTELTEKEKELMKKFALNNAELFKTLQLEILDPKIVDVIGESSLEKITRYKDVQRSILEFSKDESALKVFGFALENLKMDNMFIEPLIEKLSNSISSQRTREYSLERKEYVYESAFLDLVSQRIDRKDIPFTDYEKAVISYLALNPQEGRKITNYDEILTFVERKNNELESIVNNADSTLLEVKNAYLERLVGLNYDVVVNLVTMYGNDPEQLLQNYENVSPESFKELGEKEALEIIIKLKSLIETQDIGAITSEFHKQISQEKKEESFIRYQNSTVLENSLRRAYGRDMVDSLSKNIGILQEQELEFEGEKYLVRKVNGEFNRMVSLLGAYRKSTTNDGDMYDRWNTNKMANNHALCYSLINQSNPGTAMIDGKSGIIISIDGFSPESISAEAPYDLCSDSRGNIVFTWRQQRFFSAQNMSDQTRGRYSEYVIELQDVLSGGNQYKKIQPATIICFEEVDENSIRAAIELGKKLGHPIPIELIDRRELAQAEMVRITEVFNNFKTGETIDPALVSELITRFNNVRNAHISSNLSDELLGENEQNENKDALFNIEHLNQMLKECLASVEQRIRSGQVKEGLEALESIKMAISNERQKSFLMFTMYEKQLWTGIDMDIDYALDELQRTYGKPIVKPLKEIKTLETLSQMQGKDLSSVTFDVCLGKVEVLPEQLSVDQIMQLADVSKVQKGIVEIHSGGYYQGNQSYDEEHIARVILYSDVISKMEGFDDKTRELLTEVAKYYSCGRQLDVAEKHEQYSAKLAGKALANRYSTGDLSMIQATIELQNFKSSFRTLSEMEEERKSKLGELCSKYSLSEEQAVVVSKMASCISDSVKLDQTRFVDKATHMGPEQSFDILSLESESAKKMVEFSYSLQEQLAQQELDRLSSIVQMNFDVTIKNQIMKDFFTIIEFGAERTTKDKAITQSPIVRLEYLKTKYPEIAKIDLEALVKEKQIEVVSKENKSSELLQLEAQKRQLRRQQFEARVFELGIQIDPVLTLDKLFQQQEVIQQQALEQGTELDTHHGMTM